ncbi:MAG: cofactor assembly of complex C subunit B, partial [Gloeomargarita sp. SKYG116]|nr:cofactor assembly of complex C subunit B [Gloeomargarita sp. SKYG116]MDW8402419.1 cofactor assembly of complex C subunit B [Gloeomargarita sp. SKYGB_i_bin116]
MANLALVSTGLLTGLLAVGLIFFVRAAVKDRTQTQVIAPAEITSAMHQLGLYLQRRGYWPVTGATGNDTQVWQGQVRPSVFLALLLSLLVGLSGL